MAKTKTEFKVGDIVCYTSAFLRSCAWYTNVPVNGKVIAVEDSDPAWSTVTVQWSDGHESRVNTTNVCLYDQRHMAKFR